MAGTRTSFIRTRAGSQWQGALVACGALVSAGVIGALGMAHALSGEDPARAIAWHSGNAEALARINERETDPMRKAARARRVLASQPLDGRAYRQLAEVEDAAGNRERAYVLYTIATRHSPRDRLARAWLADNAYALADHRAALRHVDALLRMDAELREPLFERLVLLSADDAFRSALMDLLRSPLVWRAQFLAWLDGRPDATSPGGTTPAGAPPATGPGAAGFADAVGDALSRMEDPHDRDLPFGP